MSIVIGRALPMGGGTSKRLEFAYTGQYNERLDDGVVELLTSGVLKVTKDTYIDAFLLGGGGAGSGGNNRFSGSWIGGGGGAGGFTKTIKKLLLKGNVEYSVVIGAGGIALSGSNAYEKVGPAGGNTVAFGYTVEGGKSASSPLNGGNGGSGGGAGGGNGTPANPTDGASDGNNALSAGNRVGGTGQGTTTREFAEATGKLYAGGGAGANGSASSTSASGGEGGGANQQTSAAANTGGGGGGGIASYNNGAVSYPGSGGSGIVCIRLHKKS